MSNYYETGKIYQIHDIRDMTVVYVGSTIQILSVRMTGHRARASSRQPSQSPGLAKHMAAEGIEHFQISLIENWPCKSKTELIARQFHWIQKLQPKCNVQGKSGVRPPYVAKAWDRFICHCGMQVSSFPGPLGRHFRGPQHKSAMDADPVRCIRYLFQAPPDDTTKPEDLGLLLR